MREKSELERKSEKLSRCRTAYYLSKVAVGIGAGAFIYQFYNMIEGRELANKYMELESAIDYISKRGENLIKTIVASGTAITSSTLGVNGIFNSLSRYNNLREDVDKENTLNKGTKNYTMYLEGFTKPATDVINDKGERISRKLSDPQFESEDIGYEVEDCGMEIC